MLRLRKGFGFAGAWTVVEQNRMLAFCFGLSEVNEAQKKLGRSAQPATCSGACDKPEGTCCAGHGPDRDCQGHRPEPDARLSIDQGKRAAGRREAVTIEDETETA